MRLNTIIPTTTGYKTARTIEVGDKVFDINNQPVEVSKVSDVKYNYETLYKLVLNKNYSNIELILDKDQTLVKYIRLNEFEDIKVEDLSMKDKILGNFKSNWLLLYKSRASIDPIRHIEINSDDHAFLITDSINSNWVGGNHYKFDGIYIKDSTKLGE